MERWKGYGAKSNIPAWVSRLSLICPVGHVSVHLGQCKGTGHSDLVSESYWSEGRGSGDWPPSIPLSFFLSPFLHSSFSLHLFLCLKRFLKLNFEFILWEYHTCIQCVLIICTPSSYPTPPRTPRTLPTAFALMLFFNSLSPVSTVTVEMCVATSIGALTTDQDPLPEKNSSLARDRALWFHLLFVMELLLARSCIGSHSSGESMCAVVMSRKHCFSAALHNFKLLLSFYLPLQGSLSFEENGYDIDVPFRAEYVTVIFSHFDLLWVFVLKNSPLWKEASWMRSQSCTDLWTQQ